MAWLTRFVTALTFLALGVIFSPETFGSKSEGQHPPRLTTLLKLAHLLCFSTAWGAAFWVTFIGGIIMFKNLPRHQFGNLQSKMFPAYFSMVGVCCAVAVGAFGYLHPWKTSAAAEKYQLGFLLAAFAFNLSNLIIFTPMTIEAADPSTKNMVTTTFEQASKHGMNVARTWAFSDGGYRPLQVSPGVYNEEMFKGLDFVLSEAKKHGVYLILTFVNNWEGFGGKRQYVQWARDKGQYVNNEDDFFSNSVIKGYYKNHIKSVVTRVNSITGVAYKDDPTIFAWELMNEPRCQSNLSGKPLQDWVEEMSAYVKSMDKNHLLEVGLEGFYGESISDRKQFNPGYQVGTDFISNNRIANVDFATIHLYPDQWVSGSNEQAQAEFVEKWLQSHIEDSKSVLRKPIMLTEFGKSSRSGGYSVAARDSYFGNIFGEIYSCARSGGPCGGALFWQIMAQGMENWSDGYEVVLEQSPSTAGVIDQQSRRISSLNN